MVFTEQEISYFNELLSFVEKQLETNLNYVNVYDNGENDLFFNILFEDIDYIIDSVLPLEKRVPRRSYTDVGGKDRHHKLRYDLMDLATAKKELLNKNEKLILDYWILGTKDSKYRSKIVRDNYRFKKSILKQAVKLLGKKKIIDIEEIKEDIQILKEIEKEEYEEYQREIEYEDSLLISEDSAAY
jgi:hypothetical protein